MFTDPSTGDLTNGIAKVRYSHDAMIDLIVADPSIRQNDLAALFDRSPSWVSLVLSSDAFQARLSERKSELIDPEIRATINDRLSAVAQASLGRILEKLTGPLRELQTDDFLVKSAKLASDALGYGAKGPSTQTNVAVVIQVPPKIASSRDWANTHAQVVG